MAYMLKSVALLFVPKDTPYEKMTQIEILPKAMNSGDRRAIKKPIEMIDKHFCPK